MIYTQGGLPAVPQPQLQEVVNETGFPALAFDKMGKGRLFYDVVLCKATFRLADGTLGLDEQQALCLADQYWDPAAAQRSSLRVANDAVLYKPGTDVLVTGSARTPARVPRARWDGGVVIARGDKMLAQHGLHFSGPRHWQYRWTRGWKLSAAEPVLEVAMRHENAWGGRHTDDQRVLVNPAGCGAYDTASLDPELEYRAPQLELPGKVHKAMGQIHQLAAMAPMPPFWLERQRYAGTYDAAWQAQFARQSLPDYPSDFDVRFYHYAIPSLRVTPYLTGVETIHLLGMVPGYRRPSAA
ncbi:MAG TPA: DUF2169 domain-containing protein [Burkholderiaceae bacterium]